MGPLGERSRESRRARGKVLQTMHPQEGKEQIKTPSQGLGPIRAQGRVERGGLIPAPCCLPLGPWPFSPPHGSGRHGPGIHHRSEASWCPALCWEGTSRGNRVHGDPAVGELTVWRGRSEAGKSLSWTACAC